MLQIAPSLVTTVNREYFTEVGKKGVPSMNPLSLEYRDWWKTQRDRCLNGYWVGGVWMPGRLYFYVNFWNIELNKNGALRKSKGIAMLRDVEWEIAYLMEYAKGFTGKFDEDRKPIYDLDRGAQGIMLMGGRGSGKSYSVAGMGAGYEYTFYKNNEVIVSAAETKYSNDHMKKVKFGLDNLPGAIEFNGEYYPSPLSHKRIKDDWQKEVRSGYEILQNGNKIVRGYNSRIFNVVFKDNPQAAAGKRASFHVFEEVGAFPNLINAYSASKYCWVDGEKQFGVPFLLGTGGDMDKGTLEAAKMFYDPETYNILSFEDRFENKGKISYFLPGYMYMDRAKDQNGFTNITIATDIILKDREKLRQGKDKKAYYNSIQFVPLIPSEAFLSTKSNMFPVKELQEQLARVTNDELYKNAGQTGVLMRNTEGKLRWVPELLEQADYPTDKGNPEGCIVIWEHPVDTENPENIPYGLYVAGTDPYAHDQSTTDSLGSTFIYKRIHTLAGSHDLIVAEYTGRPRTTNEYYENVRRLLEYYNAKTLYENMDKGLKQFLETKYSLHLLKESPNILREIVNDSRVERGYGVHMTQSVKSYGELMIRDWLIEEYEPGKLNLYKIMSAPLLKELINYNDDGNFDRVIAFMLTLIHNFDLHRIIVEERNKFSVDPFFSKKLFQK